MIKFKWRIFYKALIQRLLLAVMMMQKKNQQASLVRPTKWKADYIPGEDVRKFVIRIKDDVEGNFF